MDPLTIASAILAGACCFMAGTVFAITMRAEADKRAAEGDSEDDTPA